MMRPLLQQQRTDERLLIGISEPDDAAVYRMDDQTALVFTADFITPVVDDAYMWGAIAAVNSMSDVYAMGGRPALVLNIVGFPKDMPTEIATKVMEGGFTQVREAGALVVGGHTVEDEEPKFGLAVIGFANPNQLLRKGNAKPGDYVVLTKSIGTGLLAKCGKHAVIAKEHLDIAQRSMLTSNKVASEVAITHRLSAGTDVTGFALLGHMSEMANLSHVQFDISYDSIPVLPGALIQAKDGSYWPTKTWENQEYFGGTIEFSPNLQSFQKDLLFSPETSGGLLVTVSADKLENVLSDLRVKGQVGHVIGRVTAGEGIVVRP